MLKEMQGVPGQRNFGVANVDGGTFYDCRLRGGSQHFEPFKMVQDFHRHLRGGFEAHLDRFLDVS